MRVLLINPDQRLALDSEAGDLPSTGSGPYPPLGLLYLQAALEEAGHPAEILDANAEAGLGPGLRAAARRGEPQLLGVTAVTPNLAGVQQAVARAREAFPEAAVVIGGPHTDIFPTQTAALDGVDYVLCGEAEQTLVQLAGALDDGDRQPEIRGLYTRERQPDADNAFPELVKDLDSLAVPDRGRLPVRHYRGVGGQDVLFATMMTSRGCPFRCTFCSTPRGRYRSRSVEAIIDEMERCARLGVQHIYFVDDTFPVKGRRLTALCDQIAQRPHLPRWSCRTAAAGLTAENVKLMKRAGCERIQIGVETCTDEGLQILGKNTTIAQVRDTFRACRRAGVDSMAYFMLGLPNERTPADVRRLSRFAKKLEPTYAMFNVLTLYPGTRLLAEAEGKGLVQPGVWEQYAERPDPAFVQPIWDEFLARDQLNELQAEAYRAFYLRPSVVLRELRAGGVRRKARAGIQMLLGKLRSGS